MAGRMQTILDTRTINLALGTHYSVEQIEAMDDADVAELVAVAQIAGQIG